MTVLSAPTRKCLGILLGPCPSSAPLSATVTRLHESIHPTKTLAIPRLRLQQAGPRFYNSGAPRPWSMKSKKGLGSRNCPKTFRKPKVLGSGMGRKSLIQAAEEYAKGTPLSGGGGDMSGSQERRDDNATTYPPPRPRPMVEASVPYKRLDKWETEGVLFLPYDRETLYKILEQVTDWSRWLRGFSHAKVLATKKVRDPERPGEKRTVTDTVAYLLGHGNSRPEVRFFIHVLPGTFVRLFYKPKNTTTEETQEKFQITWHLTDSIGPELGTQVKLEFLVQSYPNVVLNCEQTWGRGFAEDAEKIIASLGDRASVLQSEATNPQPAPELEEDNWYNFVRRQPARSLTMRERGNVLIRRVKANGATDEERQRLQERFRSLDFSRDS
ncbi:hypothetical protein VP1G_07188 [Cytospora mali]|uniref:Uncharacterized protein n=1 Tax=Cytospora mali TaxID=578113 RepID=A0A194V810_CYTMA|nr:hypothetical protein VP1G_07188 [Valsa mali var. pyri (nom. inval.)]